MVNEYVRKKIYSDSNGNSKLFWKKVNKMNDGKIENCCKIKKEKQIAGIAEDKVHYAWKIYKITVADYMRKKSENRHYNDGKDC